MADKDNYTQPAALHQKNEALGTKAVVYGSKIWIEGDDAKEIKEGEKITLMKWGNCTISKKTEESGKITLYGNLNLEDQDFKGTKKLTWLTNDPQTMSEIQVIEYAHLIDKQKIDENDKVEDLVNKNSKLASVAYAEGSVKSLQKGDII